MVVGASLGAEVVEILRHHLDLHYRGFLRWGVRRIGLQVGRVPQDIQVLQDTQALQVGLLEIRHPGSLPQDLRPRILSLGVESVCEGSSIHDLDPLLQQRSRGALLRVRR